MASSNLKFTYFDLRGLGEACRLILAYGLKEYEEKRVAFSEWPNMKPNMPLGQMPILEIDGEIVPESVALQNFLAREFGLYPAANRDALVVDLVTGICGDIVKAQATWYYLPDSEKKWELKAQSLINTVKYLNYLEGMLRKSGSGYFVGSSVTLADILVFDLTTGFLRHSLNYSPEKYPLIAKTCENVLKVDSVGKYVASRPDSEW